MIYNYNIIIYCPKSYKGKLNYWQACVKGEGYVVSRSQQDANLKWHLTVVKKSPLV